jgi:mannose/cellobiose epimerase-like protein (N-acyl-D-glucosamine 2-epimerase family)
MTYNLSSDQAARINYDNSKLSYFQDQIKNFAQYAPISEIDSGTFKAWFDAGQETTDNPAEARARARSQFEKALFEAKFEASEYGVAVPYAPGYTAYVTDDDERGWYHTTYCKDGMPPHETSHAQTLDLAFQAIKRIGGDFIRAAAIEGE